MSGNRGQSLAKVCKDLMLKQPFYGIYLLMLDKRWSAAIPTAGVSKLGINYQLLMNEEFWDTLEHDHKIGLIHHEILHICFFHLLRHDEFEDQKLANIAMDLEINQYIPKQNLPPGGMTLDTFPDLKLEPRKGTRYYYDKLKEVCDNSPFIQAVIQAMKDGVGVCQGGDADGTIVPNHDWGEFENISESEKKLLKTQIDFHLKEIATQVKSRGTIPGEMQSYIESLFQVPPAKFDWKGYLRRFTGGSTKVYTKKLQRKQNKRFEEDSGLKIKTKRHILVGVDTSGSVSDKELLEFLYELHHIQNTGTQVTLGEFDASLQYVAPFDKKKNFEIHGRGGTDFNAIVEYANENHRKYTCLIVFTDGEAPAPNPVPKLKTLWVHSSQSNINENLPGFKIKLDI